MSKMIMLIIFLHGNLIVLVQSAKILGVFPGPSISHQVVFQTIWKELSLRGHEVTVLTPNPLNDSNLVNLTEINLDFAYDILKSSNVVTNIANEGSVAGTIKLIHDVSSIFVAAQLANADVQSLLKDNFKHFDVILAQNFFGRTDIYALSERFDCPLIGISSSQTLVIGRDAIGNPIHPVLYPDAMLPFADTSGFFDRIHSTCYVIWYRFYHQVYFLPEQDKIARSYISGDIPYVGDIGKKISIMLSNENPTIFAKSPSVPAFIKIDSMHINKEKRPLPEDLQKELDNAKKGVIYFSLGTNVKSANLPEQLRKTIIDALSELPYKILWKWEKDYLPGQPKNVIVRKWFPQQDILGHPNVKAFLTQGGLQSLEESIFNGVPMIGMPVFLDQTSNVLRMVSLGIGQALSRKTLTKEQLKAAITEVAENPKYRNRVKEISILMSDTSMTGLEKAIWWIEYVIRHKGASHLRSPAVNLPWYQYLLLDVIGFLFGVTFISIFMAHKIISLSIRLVRNYILT